MIIDFHTHIFSPKIKNNREKYIARDSLFKLLYANPKAILADVDDLIRSMDEQGIAISVVLNINWSNPELCQETNDYILEAILRYPNRLIGFGMVALDYPDKALKELERCTKGGIKGIGEIRPTHGFFSEVSLFQPLARYMMENNLILLTHSSEPLGHIYTGKGDISPEALYPLIASYPGLKIVCAHWGGGLPFYALMPEVKKTLENVFFDSAASPFLYSSQIYNQVSQLIGSDKILFGSDYPLLQPKRLLKEIEALELATQVKDQILAENAASLLEIKK
jgi:uncharacterized protein